MNRIGNKIEPIKETSAVFLPSKLYFFINTRAIIDDTKPQKSNQNITLRVTPVIPFIVLFIPKVVSRSLTSKKISKNNTK